MKDRFVHPKDYYRSALIFLLLVASIHLQAQNWELIKSFQPAQTLHSIKFASENVGYTVSTLYNGSTYNIHKTMDGGDSWIDQSSGHTATRFKDIFIVSEDTVFMCGNFGIVIHTYDGGENWITDTVSANQDHFFGISFVGETGYVCGNSGAIYKTINLGETWEQVTPPFITAIEEIYFLTPDFGFICGLNFIYYTEDGGNTWTEPETFPGATTNWWLREFTFPGDSVGFVSADIGQVYKTEDRGKNWEYMEDSPTTESLQSIYALDENVVYACGYTGTVMRSDDGAKNWQVMTAGSSQHFYGMDFTPEGNGFICTQVGEVLSYFDPYLSVDEMQAATNVKVYPNPASDFITIDTKYEITGIEMFDFYGGKVLKQRHNRIDLMGIAPGIYFLLISSTESQTIMKITVQ